LTASKIEEVASNLILKDQLRLLRMIVRNKRKQYMRKVL